MPNKYTYSVPFTPEELHSDYYDSQMTQSEIGAKWGVSQHVVHTAMKKCGFLSRKAAPRNQKMELNNNWKGGRYLQPPSKKRELLLATGYWMVYMPDHTHAQSAGYVYEHILVALKKYGLDRIPAGCCVHHSDLRKDNNDPSNLYIMTRKDHAKAHNMIEEMGVLLLLDPGLIYFSEEKKTYVRRDANESS